MGFSLLLAECDPEFRVVLRELTRAVQDLLPIDLAVNEAGSLDETQERIRTGKPDAVLLDWNVARETTPGFVAELQVSSPGIRVMVMLPGYASAYRRAVWDAGACASIPRDRLEAEWLATAVCIMQRAKMREANLRQRIAQACPVVAEVLR